MIISCCFLHLICKYNGNKKAKQKYLLRLSVGVDLSSRHVAMQVLSALVSLTAVFGMGTGGPSLS